MKMERATTHTAVYTFEAKEDPPGVALAPHRAPLPILGDGLLFLDTYNFEQAQILAERLNALVPKVSYVQFGP